MSTISERIKYIRANFSGKKMSQEEFGKKLGLSRGEIANLEDAENRMKSEIPDSKLKLICRTFNVRYEWLKNGVEPIYDETDPDSIIERYAPNESEYFRATIRGMLTLSDEAWIKLRNFVDDLRNGKDPSKEP